MQYIASLSEELDVDAASRSDTGDRSCFICDYWNAPDQDRENLVVLRDDHGIVFLNRYPYTNGHLLVAIGDGRPRLLDYEPEQRAALWSLVERATDLVDRTFNPQGLNFGINEGRAAGAGVPHHLHAHIVPRWAGDTNFITVVGEVRVVPDALERVYERYMATLAGDAQL